MRTSPIRFRRYRTGLVLGLGLLWVGSLLSVPAQAGPASGGTPRASRSGTMAWLTVSHPAGGQAQMVDQYGRTVILRGVNVVGLEDDYYNTSPLGTGGYSATPFWPIDPAQYQGRCPSNSHGISEPPVCEVQAGRPEYEQSSAPGSGDDLAQMRALGFDVIRLPVSWSQLEPIPGDYSSTYIDRIVQVVDWAAQQGIYVIIDMHEDNYSRFTPASAPASAPPVLSASQESGNHADGAPPWAVMSQGVPAEALAGQSVLNAYVETAFTNFWLNRTPTNAAGQALPAGEAPGTGLQDHYIGAMVQLAKRFVNDPTVVGYDIMNEPLPGFLAPGLFDQNYLYSFYARVIEALTGTVQGVPCPASSSYTAACGYPDQGVDDRRHLYFVEPMAARNLTDVAVGASAPFSVYPNLVYAPHAYTHVFTVDTDVPGGVASAVYPTSYNQAMQTASLEARALDAALFIGEYGNSNDQDSTILAQETAAQETAMVGSTLWAWKGNCGPGQTAAECEPGLWSVYQGDPSSTPTENLGLIDTRVTYLDRAWPRATAGTLQGYAYDPSTGVFSMSASGAGPVMPGDRDHETVIYAPGPLSGAVVVTGAARLDAVIAEPDGTRIVYVAPTGSASYGVELASRPSTG
ncbi:MAG TPA: cellulase family glycosylhydrolase [Acidimicrobiales bacterium]|nr:cellulase family glycosylhydrolase [Acidimicrobiales bacterium]